MRADDAVFTHETPTSPASDRDTWATPPALFRQISERLGGFDLDVCALPETAKCPRFFSPEDDGLVQPWAPHRCWLNPPFSTWGRWAEKASRESQHGASVAMLIPPKTEHRAWHQWIMLADALVFLRKRVSFHVNGRPKSGNTYGSALVVFDPLGRWNLASFGSAGPATAGWDWKA